MDVLGGSWSYCRLRGDLFNRKANKYLRDTTLEKEKGILKKTQKNPNNKKSKIKKNLKKWNPQKKPQLLRKVQVI